MIVFAGICGALIGAFLLVSAALGAYDAFHYRTKSYGLSPFALLFGLSIFAGGIGSIFNRKKFLCAQFAGTSFFLALVFFASHGHPFRFAQSLGAALLVGMLGLEVLSATLLLSGVAKPNPDCERRTGASTGAPQ